MSVYMQCTFFYLEKKIRHKENNIGQINHQKKTEILYYLGFFGIF